MEINQEREATRSFSVLMCQRAVNSDISEDFTLPDYCPDIRRVLYIKEELPVPARFMGGSRIDVNGVVDYTLVYVSGEGEVCSAPLVAEYSFSLPVDNVNEFELGEGVTIMAHTVAESSGVRVSSPRRLQIRSHLCSRVCAYARVDAATSSDGLEDESSVQRLIGEAEYAELICESSDVITLKDEYELTGEGERVSLVDCVALVDSSHAAAGAVSVGGEVRIKMLISREKQLETLTRRLPFDAEIELGGMALEDGASVRVNALVTDVSLSIEDPTVHIEVNLVLEACIVETKPMTYTKDVYSTKQNTSIESKQYMLPRLLANKRFSLSQNEKIAAADLNFPEGAEIVHSYCSVGTVDLKESDGGRELVGNCKYDLICLVGGEYTHIEARLPFAVETDIEGGADMLDATACAVSSKAVCDGEYLSLGAEIDVLCTAMGGDALSMPKAVRFLEARSDKGSQWTVCFATSEDDVWAVAKRYGVSPSCIKGDPAVDRFVVIEK